MSSENNAIERGRNLFPWKELEKYDPEFRAVIAASIHLGANATDIAGLLKDISGTQRLAKPSVEAIEQYLIHRTRGIDRGTFRTQLVSQGVPDELQRKVYENVYGYMRTHHPQRLWRNARNLRALTLYLLEKRNLSSYAITQILARQFDIKIDTTAGVNTVLNAYRVSIRRSNPKLNADELLSEARKRLADELRSGLTEAELERGETQGRQSEEKLLAAEKVAFDNWHHDWKSRVFVAEIFRQVKSKKKATLFAIQALEDTFEITADARSLRSFFKRTVSERASAIESCERDVIPEDVQTISGEVSELVQKYEQRFASLQSLSERAVPLEKNIPVEELEATSESPEPIRTLIRSHWQQDAIRSFNILKTEIFWLNKVLVEDGLRDVPDQKLSLEKKNLLEQSVVSLEKELTDMRTKIEAKNPTYPELEQLRKLEVRIVRSYDLLPETLRPFPRQKTRLLRP